MVKESQVVTTWLWTTEPIVHWSRRGYSLLELVIVLAIIASLSAIAWPRIRPGLHRSQLREAASQLAAEFSDARQKAIRAGSIEEFWFQPGSRSYEFRTAVSAPSEQPESDSYIEARAVQQFERWPATLHNAVQLPDGIVFAPRDEPQEFDHATAVNAIFPDSQPAPDVRFFPDGRATETVVRIVLQDTHEVVSVRLRGLTGGATLGPVEKVRLKIDSLSPAEPPSREANHE